MCNIYVSYRTFCSFRAARRVQLPGHPEGVSGYRRPVKSIDTAGELRGTAGMQRGGQHAGEPILCQVCATTPDLYSYGATRLFVIDNIMSTAQQCETAR